MHNINLIVITDSHTVFIFDAFLNTSFWKKANEPKYAIFFIQDIAIGSPDNEKKYAGFCTAVFT